MTDLPEKNPDPPRCLWVADLDDIVTPAGQEVVRAIRDRCTCPECRQMREVFVVTGEVTS